MGRPFGVSVNGSTAHMAPHPAAAWRTHQVLNPGDYDVVHRHEPLAPSITIPALASTSAPLVGTFHAAGERTPYQLPGLAPVLSRLAQRLSARAAVSPAAAELAQRYLGGDHHILGNGLDPARFAKPPPAVTLPVNLDPDSSTTRPHSSSRKPPESATQSDSATPRPSLTGPAPSAMTQP